MHRAANETDAAETGTYLRVGLGRNISTTYWVATSA